MPANLIFSLRYKRALETNVFSVELPTRLRERVLSQIKKYNSPLHVQRDPNDNWIDRSDALEEAESDFLTEHGWTRIPNLPDSNKIQSGDQICWIIKNGAAPLVFDAIELTFKHMNREDAEQFRQKLNSFLEIDHRPWRFADGEFFMLNADFVGARVAPIAQEALAANNFAGAADEFAKAQRELANGEVKNAIRDACNSFESVLKVLTGNTKGTCDNLTQDLVSQDYLSDLPEDFRQKFRKDILMSLSVMRNRLGAHGQGTNILEVPQVYGELAVQMAATLHNFLLAKHIARQPLKATKPKAQELNPIRIDDDIPF